MAHEVTLIDHIPVELNLGAPETTIGVASARKNLNTERITIEIVLDTMASIKLEDLASIFELNMLGFAGIRRGIH